MLRVGWCTLLLGVGCMHVGVSRLADAICSLDSSPLSGAPNRASHCRYLPTLTLTRLSRPPPLIAGLLGLPPEDMHRRARQENPTQQQQWVEEFRKSYEPYDWTRMLEG